MAADFCFSPCNRELPFRRDLETLSELWEFHAFCIEFTRCESFSIDESIDESIDHCHLHPGLLVSVRKEFDL
jgi:hypothetical protein